MAKKKFTPQWQRIRDDYLEKIKNGDFALGEQLPTEKAIMNEYHVSRITVVRAMNELAESGYITRRQGSGSIVTLNLPISSVSNTRHNNNNNNNNIALILPVSGSRDFRVLNEIDKVAREKKFVMSLYDSSMSITREREILENLEKSNIAGIIALPLSSVENLSIYSRIINNGIPLVFIDRSLPGLDVPCVKSNNYSGAKKLTDHLINSGHTKIAFLCYTRVIESENERFNGYISSLLENDIIPKKEYIIELFANSSEDSMINPMQKDEIRLIRNELYRLMHLPEPPTAIFCINDVTAIKIQQQALNLNLSVPNDLSIVGFDNLEYYSYPTIPITTCAQDFKKIGNSAISLILNMLNSEPLPTVENIPVELIIKQSVKKMTNNN